MPTVKARLVEFCQPRPES